MPTAYLIGIGLLAAGVFARWRKYQVWAVVLVFFGLCTLLGSAATDGRYDTQHCHTSGTFTRCDPSPDRS